MSWLDGEGIEEIGRESEGASRIRAEEKRFPNQREVMTFEERYEECLYWVEKRRRTIDLASIEWIDIRQLILIRLSQQYHMFDPAKGPFKKWANHVITNAIRNIWRDNYRVYARPCVGCVDNMGNENCRRTDSGLQCAQCPAYREWEAKKKAQHDIKLAVSMENHTQEVSNHQSDFMDIGAKKKIIDEKMRGKLTRQEWKAYKMLMVQNKSEEEVGVALGFKHKRGRALRMFPGYLAVLSLRHKFVELAKVIIEEEGLA